MSERGTYRERITWQRDAAAAGEQNPDYSTELVADVPCRIISLRGAETYRGRQLEARIDFVVQHDYLPSIALRSADRGSVASGLYAGKTLNISWVHTMPFSSGRPPLTEVFCTELST